MQAQRFSVDALASLRSHWDRAVEQLPDADQFCSSSVWSFAAAAAFPEADPPIIVGDGVAFCGMRSTQSAEGQRLLVGLDPIWGFATPCVGPPERAAHMLRLRLDLEPFDLAVISAQDPTSTLTAYITHALSDAYDLYEGPTESRLRADLSEGVAPWLGRRSPRFRQQLRHRERTATAAGITFVDVSAQPSDVVFDRMLAIEATGWKGRDDTGLANPAVADFYRAVLGRLSARDHMRTLIARHDDADIGFIAGGVHGDHYRGLQLSYAVDAAPFGVGHLLQWEQVRRLADEGISTYDLGMDMEYKRRWADRHDTTMSIVARRREELPAAQPHRPDSAAE